MQPSVQPSGTRNTYDGESDDPTTTIDPQVDLLNRNIQSDVPAAAYHVPIEQMAQPLMSQLVEPMSQVIDTSEQELVRALVASLFNFTGDTKDMAKEITKCLKLAKDGVHAVLVVLSVKTRYSGEEEAAIQCLEQIFGKRIFDYMILVFTVGDQLEDDELINLEDYLDDSPEPLKELLSLSDRRVVSFDNKTINDEIKNAQQVKELFKLVDLFFL
ncbi:hypothetical protein J5N97_012994 [Dioscorea zingiberensis]|uniref:AIG1-type G domain-containing protein n=1 Tax=Dioscorea zingiberensis TaxID=325984 RepID=A0A9D5HI93_9LILI|nr:hypothetical protein J5N97_012994 [Dioscorea zingiberensis]